MTDDPDYFTAYREVLEPLTGARNVLALVAGAQASGLLAAVGAGADRDAVAAATGLPVRSVDAILQALLAHDIVAKTDNGLGLAPPWRVLSGSGAFVPLADSLASVEIEARLLRSAGAAATYWSLSPEDRSVLARAVSPNPRDPDLVAGFRAAFGADPDHAVLSEGGALLELGCGVAGRALALVQALPRMRAVGVELSADLAEEARRRAVDLGVSDRFEVVCSDAADFHRPGMFDLGFWSQFFFPEDSRRAALATLHASLRSGAVAFAPLLGNAEAVAADPHGTEARSRALFRVILDSWGVPDRTPAELVSELEGAGFVDVRAFTAADGLARVRAVRP